MLENFEYVGNELTAKIDNQLCRQKVYKIIKYKTQFFNNKNLDTVLNAPIKVDLFLTYIDDEDTIPISKDVVYLKITSLFGNTTYAEKTIIFNNGIIQTTFNGLQMGEYLLQAEYKGNKFFEPTTITYQFTVEQRRIKCTFDSDNIQAYPNEKINTGITLTDQLNTQKIKECIVYYSFDNITYITQTNKNGYATLTFTAPKVLNCSEVALKYPLEISIDSIIYKLADIAKTEVTMQKYDTETTYTVSLDGTKINIEGDVIASNDKNFLSNVEYGTVVFDIKELDPHPHLQAEVNDNGHFKFTTEITQTESANVAPTSPVLYSTTLETKTEVKVIGENTVSRSYVKKHKIGFNAKVVTISDDQPVNYGMLGFIITKDNEEIYRYITELYQNNEASFYFDVSTLGDYQVQAEYYSVFEYKSSKSNIAEYTIIEDE